MQLVGVICAGREGQTLLSDGQTGDDVDVSNGDLANEIAISCEDLHSASFVASITDDEFAGLSNDGDLSRIPQLAFFFARHAELIFVFAILVENLNAVIVRVGDDDLLVDAQTEAMRSVELTFLRTERAELGAHLHRLTAATDERRLRRIIQVDVDGRVRGHTRERRRRTTVVAIARTTAVRTRIRGQQRWRRKLS